MVPIVRFKLYDRIQLKKPHPCGGSVFQILRVGSEVRIVCQTCGRDMTMNRIKLEKAVKLCNRNIIPARFFVKARALEQKLEYGNVNFFFFIPSPPATCILKYPASAPP